MKLKKQGSKHNRCCHEARSKFVVQLMHSISTYFVMVGGKKCRLKEFYSIILNFNGTDTDRGQG